VAECISFGTVNRQPFATGLEFDFEITVFVGFTACAARDSGASISFFFSLHHAEYDVVSSATPPSVPVKHHREHIIFPCEFIYEI